MRKFLKRLSPVLFMICLSHSAFGYDLANPTTPDDRAALDPSNPYHAEHQVVSALQNSQTPASEVKDPWGPSEYLTRHLPEKGEAGYAANQITWHRLTNDEAAFVQKVGLIDKNGKVTHMGTGQIKHEPIKSPDPVTSKGTVTVRPTSHPHPKLPANATKDDLKAIHEETRHIKQDLAHIERKISKALDLSLSAYAVSELPQATEGRSGVSVSMAAANGKTAEAIGFSSNFGDKHEYTVKISVSHSGSQEAAGAGFSYQW